MHLVQNQLHRSEKLTVTRIVSNFLTVVEPESSLLCPEESATNLCSEPEEFNPHRHILFL